ncbi:MAG: DivIVA domain-containing protein [Clostridia bacterium]|nr:DivIVA domain-containing protein [Clostridia bacterium]
MITPMDLRTKTFKKAINGYDKKEIDDYMELLLADYEKIYKQSVETTDKINTLTKLLDSYKAMEDTMKNSLIVAQTTAEELTKNAREKADLTIEEANVKAKEIIAEANGEVSKIQAQIAELKTAMELYKSRAVGMLNAQIEVVSKFDAE